MTFAVRYYTKTGHTKKLAEAVAEALGVEALPITSPVTEKVDVLFLGNSYYAFNIDSEVKKFIAGLNKELVGNTTVSLPSVGEQRVIGEYLESVDDLITLQQRERVYI